MKAVIGITGRAGAGKDTLAAYFVRAHGFVRLAMADALKVEVATILRRTVIEILRMDLSRRGVTEPTTDEGWTAEIAQAVRGKSVPAIRALLQEWGTQLRRAEQPDYWIGTWGARAISLTQVVVPDVRFRNEAEHIRKAGGALIHVRRRLGMVGMSKELSQHQSERDLDGWVDYDWVVDNDGTVQALEAQAEQWVRQWERQLETRYAVWRVRDGQEGGIAGPYVTVEEALGAGSYAEEGDYVAELTGQPFSRAKRLYRRVGGEWRSV